MKISGDNIPEIIKFLRKFKKTKMFKTADEIRTGLLSYNDIPLDMAFIFKFPSEHILSFHTVGMKFNIDIMFYNKRGELIKKAMNIKPGVKNISSDKPCKWVIECKSNEVENDET